MENKERIKNYEESIEMLKLYKRQTSWKDDDIKREIQEEIDDLRRWIEKLKKTA